MTLMRILRRLVVQSKQKSRNREQNADLKFKRDMYALHDPLQARIASRAAEFAHAQTIWHEEIKTLCRHHDHAATSPDTLDAIFVSLSPGGLKRDTDQVTGRSA